MNKMWLFKKYTYVMKWHNDSLKRLLDEIKKDFKPVLCMILYIYDINTEYLDKSNKTNKKQDKM